MHATELLLCWFSLCSFGYPASHVGHLELYSVFGGPWVGFVMVCSDFLFYQNFFKRVFEFAVDFLRDINIFTPEYRRLFAYRSVQI